MTIFFRLLFIFEILFSLNSLFAQEKKNAIVENYQKLDPREAVRAILIDKQNYKWLGTDKGLYRVISMDSEPELMISDSISSLAEDKSEMVWFGNRKQQLITEDQKQKIILSDKNLEITCMSYFKGDIWVGTNNGLFKVSDDQNKILNHYTTDNSKLKSNHINMLYPDKEGKLWVGTDNGVVIIDNKKWDQYEKDHKITGAIATKDGIWLLAEKKMWLIYKEEGRDRWQDAAVKRGLSKGPVRAIVADSKGQVYIASETLVQFDPINDKILQIDKDYGFVSAQTLSLACDKNDDLWVGTADRGLFRVDIIEGEAEELSVVVFSKGEIKCPGAKTAQITVITRGGKTPYSYLWNNPTMQGAKKDTIGAGNYTVTVVDAEGEEFTASVLIKEPEPIQISVIQKERVTEINRKDGKAKIEVTGGTFPYRIIWDNGKSGLSTTNLSAGKHIVKIYDQNQCFQQAEVYIEAPRAIPDLDRKKIVVGQTLRINELYFTSDSSDISSESYLVLDEIFNFLSTNKDIYVEIGGHTNGIPPHEYCDQLSAARAKNVAQYLYEKGIPLNQISHRGYGKRVPVASNETLSGRQKNQRVEIKITNISQ